MAGPLVVACDGIIIDCKNVALGLYAADCIPMVITSDKYKFLGLIHVGTIGADLGIHTNAINLACKKFGIKASDIFVYLGPHIKEKSYKFTDVSSKNLMNSDWGNFISKKGKYFYIDLAGFVINGLVDQGVKQVNIIVSSIDTCSNNNYFSHRRSKLTGEAEGRNGLICTLV